MYPAIERRSEKGRQNPSVPAVFRRSRRLEETFVSQRILPLRMNRIERQASDTMLAHSRKRSAHSIPACYLRSSRSSRSSGEEPVMRMGVSAYGRIGVCEVHSFAIGWDL